MKTALTSIMTVGALLFSVAVMVGVFMVLALIWIVTMCVVMLALVGLGVVRAYQWGKGLTQ